MSTGRNITIPAIAGIVLIGVVPAAGQVKKPASAEGFHVMFIISDQHKTSVTGCYGNPVVQTPNIDALAATGVKFTRIYTPSPLSAPARAALMTGTYPSTNGSVFHKYQVFDAQGKRNDIEPGWQRDGYAGGMVTWGEWMKARGFATAAIGKMHVHGELQAGVHPDFPAGNRMGFDESDMRFYSHFPGGHYMEWKGDREYNVRYREMGPYQAAFAQNRFNQKLKPTLVEDEADIMDFIVAEKSGDFMTRMVARGERIFLHAGLEKPHKPWTTLQRFYDLYRVEDMQLPETRRDWHDGGRYPYIREGGHAPLTDPDDIRRTMVAYYGCVSEMDEAVGRIVAHTKQLGIYEKTIFVYTSDHGEHLMGHGLHEKHNMFEDAVSIPFIISCPALLPQGVTCASLGSLIDVLPTIAELLGCDPNPQWEGHSLLPQIGATEPWDRVVYSEINEANFKSYMHRNVAMRMRLDNEYKYIYTHGMIDQLFVSGDNLEMSNLALDPAYAGIVERYRMLTLDGLVLPFVGQMRGGALRNGRDVTLTWDTVEQACDYTVWASYTPDANHAKKIAVTDRATYTARDNGARYWWITANWNLVQKGERRENVPMVVDSYPEVLPVTPMLSVF